MRLKRLLFLFSILFCSSCSSNQTTEKKEILYAEWKTLVGQCSYEYPPSADALFNGTPSIISSETYKKEKRHYEMVSGKCSPSDELSQYVYMRADILDRNKYDLNVYELKYYDDLSVSIKYSEKVDETVIKAKGFESCTFRIHPCGYIKYINLYQRINLALGDYKESATIRFTVNITYN